ncbi:MAG: hypothetical protein JRF58_12160, partial [Deltaproteobacteria bacterium]|nr:hypothetical protein [Deltaproteobacteria bacterium]
MDIIAVFLEFKAADLFQKKTGQLSEFSGRRKQRRIGSGFPKRTGKKNSSGKKPRSFKLKRLIVLAVKFLENIVKPSDPESLGHFLKNMMDVRAAENILLRVIVPKLAVGGRTVLLPEHIVFP